MTILVCQLSTSNPDTVAAATAAAVNPSVGTSVAAPNEPKPCVSIGEDAIRLPSFD